MLVSLSDGRVLALGGGIANDVAEVFDLAAETWSPAGTVPPVKRPNGYAGQGATAAMQLASGRVLVIESIDTTTPAMGVVWDPATSPFLPAGTLTAPHLFPALIPLPGGTPLVAGGGTAAERYVGTW